MLVLTRKLGECIQIFDAATKQVVAVVEVCRLRGDRVSLGFTADPQFQIYRSEIGPGTPDFVPHQPKP